MNFCISANSLTKKYECKTTHTATPFLKIHNSQYLDLTTNSTSGLQIKVEYNNKAYRPLQTATSTNSRSSQYSSTTAYSGLSSRVSTSGYSGKSTYTTTRGSTSGYTGRRTTTTVSSYQTIYKITGRHTFSGSYTTSKSIASSTYTQAYGFQRANDYGNASVTATRKTGTVRGYSYSLSCYTFTSKSKGWPGSDDTWTAYLGLASSSTTKYTQWYYKSANTSSITATLSAGYANKYWKNASTTVISTSATNRTYPMTYSVTVTTNYMSLKAYRSQIYSYASGYLSKRALATTTLTTVSTYQSGSSIFYFNTATAGAFSSSLYTHMSYTKSTTIWLTSSRSTTKYSSSSTTNAQLLSTTVLTRTSGYNTNSTKTSSAVGNLVSTTALTKTSAYATSSTAAGNMSNTSALIKTLSRSSQYNITTEI